MNSRCFHLYHRSRKKAFTLAETVLALGLAAVSMTAVFGLLPVGLNSNQESTEQTLAANLLTTLTADLRNTPNPNPRGSGQASPLFDVAIPSVEGSSGTSSQMLYLSEDGQRVSDAGEARYQLNIWFSEPETSHAPLKARALVTWPATAPYTTAYGAVETLVALDRK